MLEYQWNGLANLFADLIGKYAGDLEINNLPDPIPITSENENERREENNTKLSLKEEFKWYTVREINVQTIFKSEVLLWKKKK